MYFEFLLRRAHSRRRVDRTYWSGVSLNSFTTCSKEVTVGTTGPIGSGLPQFGFPRRFAIFSILFGWIFASGRMPFSGSIAPGERRTRRQQFILSDLAMNCK